MSLLRSYYFGGNRLTHGSLRSNPEILATLTVG